MLKHSTPRSAYILFLLLISIILSAIFQTNLFGFANGTFFNNFQQDAEALVLGAIVADDYNLDKHGANIGYIAKDGSFNENNILDSYAIFTEGSAHQNLQFEPYRSQYGILGTFYSWLHNIFEIKRLETLQLFSSISLAIGLVLLFVLYRKILDTRFAAIFIITLGASPWIISFARNLFWTPVLWLLPALFGALMYLAKNPAAKALLLFGVAAATFLKSLAGYEYISSIALFASLVFVVGPYFDEGNKNPRPDFKGAGLVLVACVVGFVLALLLHASVRGDSIVGGLRAIFEEDVKRRTYGDPSAFDPAYRTSLEASPFYVVARYLVKWRSPVTLWLPGMLFVPLIGLAMAGLCLQLVARHRTFKRDLILLGFTFLAPLSWLLLAKAHSYIHIHMNFVLWYLGFVPALCYVILNSVEIILSKLRVGWGGSIRQAGSRSRHV